MRFRDHAPIGYTCPDIDGIIRVLEGVRDRISDIADQLDCCALSPTIEDLQRQVSNVEDLFSGRRSPLEELRSANDLLRTWGNQQVERADEAEREVERLKNELDDLESRV